MIFGRESHLKSMNKRKAIQTVQHRFREQTYGYQAERGSLYTPRGLKWITDKDLPYSTRDSAECHVAAWIGVGFGGEWITRIWTAESLHHEPGTITTLLIGSTPI